LPLSGSIKQRSFLRYNLNLAGASGLDLMSPLTDLPELIGFFSYSRDDDEDSNGALSALRDRIQREVRGQLGRSMKTFRLWQDKEAIAPGRLWEEEIKTAVRQAVFFIPIITPTVVRSPHCKFELESFLAREAELGRSDLVFPILYIRVPELEDSARQKNDPVLSIIARRQYLDWRDLRHRDVDSSDVKGAIERFCAKICDALDRSPITSQERGAADAAPPPRVGPERKPAITETERPTPVVRQAAPIAPAQTPKHTLMIGSLLGAAAVAAIGIWLVVAPPRPSTVTATPPTAASLPAMPSPITPSMTLPPAAPAPPQQPTQSPPLTPTLAPANGFIFPDSDRRYLTLDELRKLSSSDLRIARNEIFAREGRYFRDPQLAGYFAQFSWYKPYSYDVPLNNIENANVALIQSMEH
jgi:hypothetical protein